MPSLVPHPIVEAAQSQRDRGQLDAVTLFVDISGFTKMTRALMAHGARGADQLGALMRGAFAPLVAAVHARGGFVTHYAGDAFTAVFPGSGAETARAAREAAAEVQREVSLRSDTETPLGTFSLAAKVGLSAGRVLWGIVGPPEHRAWYFRGPAIDGCAASEARAERGQIVADAALLSRLVEGEHQPLEGGYALLSPTAAPSAPPAAASPAATPDAEVVRFFPSIARAGALRGEFRSVVAVFLSFEGVEQHGELDALASATIREADRLGGFFNQLGFGDKGGTILVTFGAPVRREDDLARAWALLLRLRERLELPGLRWRAGVHTGPAYAGLIGSDERCEYTALGDVVNLAARLMTRAVWGEALGSDAARRVDGFRFEPRGAVRAKGFAEPVPAWRLLGRRGRSRESGAAIVGRDAELERLSAQGRALAGGRGAGVALLYGEAGVGKSRLADALIAQIDGSVQRLTAWSDTVLPTPFGPFAAMARRWLGLSGEEGDALRERYERATRQRLLDLEVAGVAPSALNELRLREPALAALLGARPDDDFAQLPAQARYRNTLLALRALVLVEAERQPVALLLEDAHRLDAPSRAALEILSRESAARPLWLIVTSRYDDAGARPALALDPDAPKELLDLQPLASLATVALARGVLGAPIDAELAAELHGRAQGNPLFTEQLVFFLQERGLLRWDEAAGAWRGRVDALDALPGEVEGVLVARIDRLAPPVKEAVLAASVLGLNFQESVLVRMVGDGARDRVSRATDRGIWTPRDELEYVFRHALLREAAYQMQLPSDLRRSHARAAEALTEVNADDPSRVWTELAHHHLAAEQRGPAAEFCGLAGGQALERYANEQARDLLRRALELLPETARAERFERMYQLDTALHNLADREGAQDLVEALVALGDELGPAEATRALRREATFRQFEGDYARALASAERAVRCAEDAGLRSPLAHALLTLAHIQRDGEAVESAERSAERALEIAIAEGNTAIHGESERVLARLVSQRGRLQEARSLAERAVARAKELKSLPLEGGALQELGLIARLLNDFDTALAALERVAEIMNRLGDRRAQTGALMNLAITHASQHRHSAARRYMEDALARTAETGHRYGRTVVINNLSVLAIYTGRLDDAERLNAESIEIAEALTTRESRVRAQANRAMIYLYQDRFEDASRAARRAVELLGDEPNRMLRSYVDALDARAMMGLGRLAEAAEALARVERSRRDLDQRPLWLEYKAVQAQHHLASGRQIEALAAIEPVLERLQGAFGLIDHHFLPEAASWQVLSALGDARAEGVLLGARARLREQLDGLESVEERRAFLTGAPSIRALVAALETRGLAAPLRG